MYIVKTCQPNRSPIHCSSFRHQRRDLKLAAEWDLKYIDSLGEWPSQMAGGSRGKWEVVPQNVAGDAKQFGNHIDLTPHLLARLGALLCRLAGTSRCRAGA
jgi:hypothetical protein